MKRKKLGLSPSTRIKMGASLLNAAQVVDVNGIKPRLDAFAMVHGGYCEAQRKVDEADREFRTEQLRVLALDADQDEAVEALALCLANDKQPRNNPFAAFVNEGPGTIRNMPFAEEAKAIHELVALVQRNKSLSKATVQAAQKAEEAAQKVEAFNPS